MDVKIILKVHSQQKCEHIPSGFSMSAISSFKTKKLSTMYTEVKIA